MRKPYHPATTDENYFGEFVATTLGSAITSVNVPASRNQLAPLATEQPTMKTLAKLIGHAYTLFARFCTEFVNVGI